MNYNPPPPFSGALRIGESIRSPWEKWFAWYPVQINNRWVWLKTIYRREFSIREDVHIYTAYQYGTIFDVLHSRQ